MDWRDLIFVHWNVDPDAVRRLVPRGLALDLLPDGRAIVSLVAFRTEAARLRPLPRFIGLDFAQVNVRTYVRAGQTSGVYFFSLDATSRAFAIGGRLFGLPYGYARLEHSAVDGVIGFHGRRATNGPSLALRVEPRLSLGHERGFEAFVHERYTMFWPARGGLRAQTVKHAPLSPVRAHIAALEETLTRAAGLDVHRSVPTAYYVEHADVSIYAPEQVLPLFGPSDACLAAS